MIKNQLESLLEFARACWKHRRGAIWVSWATFVVLATSVALAPSKYSARAQLYVSSSSVLEPLLQGVAITVESGQKADVVKRGLLARQTLDRVARESGLYEKATTPEARDGVISGLSKAIDISGNTTTRVYSMSYSHRNPIVARDVVQSLLSTFIKGSTTADSADTKEATEFFTQQVSDYAERLNAAEKALADFKKSNIGLMPDDRGDYFSRLQQEMAALEKLETEYSVAKRRQNELRTKMVSSGSSVVSSNMPTAEQIQQATRLDAHIAESQRALEELLLKYTERHPQVVALRNTIQSLEARRKSVAGNVRATSGTAVSTSGGEDSVVLNLQIALNDADVQVAALETQVTQGRGRVAEMRRLVSIKPEIEAKLQQLNRDYGVIKERYETSLKRLESANTSGQVDKSTMDRFQVIEEPRLPIRPDSPPRFLLTMGALVLALGVGFTFAAAIATVRPVFMDRRTVEETLKLPVVGVISRARTPTELSIQRSRRRVDLTLIGSLVLSTIAVGMAAEPISKLVRTLVGLTL